MQTKDRTQGLTIIEVLVSIFIIGIILTLVMGIITRNLQINGESYRKAEAIRATEMTLESYRQRKDYATLAALGTDTQTQNINGRNYSVRSVFCDNGRSDEIKRQMPCAPTAIYIDSTVSFNNKVLNSVATYYTRFGRTDE